VKRSDVNVTFVGPSWGKDVSKKAQKALIVFFLVIATYISLRFEYKMAIAAIVAMLHDILVTVGIYALSGLEVSPATVVAFLTILGYSLYDTIVVFDKVAENEKNLGASGKIGYSDIVNLSMNQTLMRSLNTSFVAILPILSMLVLGVLVLGATALGDFGLALFIGLLTGAYSSIFVASPLLAFLKEREPQWKAVRDKLAARGAVTFESAALARVSAGAAGGIEGPKSVGALFPTGTPRGRKQGKKR
jgi:preprotein translocase subunit SecF